MYKASIPDELILFILNSHIESREEYNNAVTTHGKTHLFMVAIIKLLQ